MSHRNSKIYFILSTFSSKEFLSAGWKHCICISRQLQSVTAEFTSELKSGISNLLKNRFPRQTVVLKTLKSALPWGSQSIKPHSNNQTISLGGQRLHKMVLSSISTQNLFGLHEVIKKYFDQEPVKFIFHLHQASKLPVFKRSFKRYHNERSLF